MDKQVINAKIRARIVPKVSGSIRGTINNVVKGEIRGEIGRAAIIPEAFIRHLVDYDNPHKTTAAQVKAVPLRLAPFGELKEPTSILRNAASVYVDDGENSYKMSLEDVKAMSTKIVSVDSVEDADFDKLSIGDYIYSKK